MKKNTIRWISTCLACSFIALMASGCTQKTPANGNNAQSGNGAAQTPAGDYKSLKKYDPPITITLSSTITPEKLQEQGGNMSLQGAYPDWARDTLGINYEYKWAATDDGDAKQKLQVGIASGETPDVIGSITPEMVQQLAATDQIYCMQDLIEQYGSPLTKYMYEEYDKQANGQGFSAVTYNGKYYAVPVILDTVQAASDTQWIRQDILDELKLPMPTTIKEFENVMAAYKAKYPKGVGYIYSLSFTDQMNAGEPIFSAFGAHPQHWLEKDGKVVYGSIQPEVKEGLAVLSDWYKKGYIDADFASKDFWAQGSNFTNGDALSMMTPFWGYGWSFPVLNRANPKATVVPMPLLKGPNGEENEGLYLNFTTPWPAAISKSCKNPEALIFELNMALDSYFRNDDELRAKFDFHYPKTEVKTPSNPDEVKAEGIKVAKYDYKPEEVGPSFFALGSQQAGGPALISDKSCANILIDTSLRIHEAIKNNTFDSLSQDDKLYYQSSIMTRENMENNEMAANAHFLNVIQMQKYFSEGKMKYDAFLGAPSENMKNNNAYLTKLELQTFADIITGKATLDSFDEFVETWNKNGGETVTADVNKWYSENK